MSTAGLFPADRGDTYNFIGVHGDLIRARLAYIERHGARFLFNNDPPPVPGYPTLRCGKIVRRL